MPKKVMRVKRSVFVLLLIFSVLFIDQSVKVWIKLNMFLGEEHYVFGWEWFRIHFTENPGMAFGMQIGGSYGKLILSLFRIVAVSFIGYYLYSLIKLKSPRGLLSSIALIFAGAVGNILDSMFYGLIFSSSEGHHLPATFMPEGGGYAGFLYGKVVDMFYFPIVEGTYPNWLPFVGGDHFSFFQPIFNVADAAISIGVVLIIIFHKQFFQENQRVRDQKEEADGQTSATEVDH